MKNFYLLSIIFCCLIFTTFLLNTCNADLLPPPEYRNTRTNYEPENPYISNNQNNIPNQTTQNNENESEAFNQVPSEKSFSEIVPKQDIIFGFLILVAVISAFLYLSSVKNKK